MLQGDGEAFRVRLHTAGGGRVVVCCFKATKEEEQADNLHWFCLLNSCTAVLWSSSCARVPILGVPSPVGEGRGLSCRKFQILMRQRKKAKQNKTHLFLKNARSGMDCLWTHRKATAGWGGTPCAVPIKEHCLAVKSTGAGVWCIECMWVCFPKQLYKCASWLCSCLPYFLSFIHQVVGAVSGSSIKPKSGDFRRYCCLVKEIHPQAKGQSTRPKRYLNGS